MTHPHRPDTELTAAERAAYHALEQETRIDAAEEDRTVAALRARGLFGGTTAAPHGGSVRAARPLRIAAALVAAAAVVAISMRLAGTRKPLPAVAAAPESVRTAQVAAANTSSHLVWY